MRRALRDAVGHARERRLPGQNGKIAYVSPEDGDDEIFVMNQDGTGPVQLTHNALK